ncbi:response regulator [Gloeocapsa sp. PCC 73106]|uniref:response regulator n=1 Tax=Gloeocapsa sp. PCC 73106 TaxID=102232 RepID=UPI0002AC6541|nr:response regulator [Gloeocapsa sp. PCC 73106]ELR98130.1 response regulator containing a CheY-like receiver domain and a GGDEF domain [Gloeocapsa sp. PCC 73106]
MTPEDNTNKPLPSNSIKEFTAYKQTGFFDTLKQPRFSGQLELTSPNDRQWVFYLYLGRIVYATGGFHPVRRWRRNLSVYFPHMPSHLNALQSDIDGIPVEELRICWEYQLLCLWVEQQKVTLEQAAKMIRAIIVEVLFDITQAMQVTCKLSSEKSLSTRLVLIDAEQVIAEAQKLWQGWQAAKIADRFPDMAPIIAQPEQLQRKTSEQIYHTLSQLLDGQQTLRDLAVRMKRDVLTVTRSLLPYIQEGLVKLIPIPDFPAPAIPHISGIVSNSGSGHKHLIACVDDSPLVCQSMEKILTQSGYEFLGINDALRAIAILLSRKPDLIFLDLIMPNANGYEICSQLRKLSFFRHTPIVILTGNDGIIDRVRAKMVGSSDFLSKPVDAEIVVNVIRKHLREGVNYGSEEYV